MKNLSAVSNIRGFSLVEVTIAMAIAAIALVSLVGLIPTATKDSADSADQTAIGTMFEDVEERIKNSHLEPGMVVGSPFFYDLRGSYIAPETGGEEVTSIVTDRFYRVEAQLIEPVQANSDSPTFGNALAVQVKMFWPINELGEAIHPEKPGSEIIFLAGAKTGPGWNEVDPEYQLKIE